MPVSWVLHVFRFQRPPPTLSTLIVVVMLHPAALAFSREMPHCAVLRHKPPSVTNKQTNKQTKASAVLQRSHFESVNSSDGRKVREWLDTRGGPVDFGAYEPAVYLQAVASRTNRVRLAQFRTGSHWLGVETGRWAGLQREQRCCKRCGESEIDDAQHMIWGCPALIDQRLQHMGLFSDGEATVEAFMQHEPADLAAFVRHCADRCAELEGWGSRPD